MDELERLYRRLVQNLRAGFPELLTRSFEVSQLYQQVVPYRTNRRELEFDSNEDYELALMQLLAGLRGYLSGDVEMQKAMRQELASPNPDLGAFRVYATAMVTLAPEPLRALGRHPAAGEAPRPAAMAMSPGAQAALAGRATEAVDVSGQRPPVPPPAPRSEPKAPVSATPPQAPKPPASAPRAPTPLAMAGSACRYCGGVLPEGRRVTFCPSCGHNLTVQHCPACATELEVGWSFCITCGRGVGK